MVCDEERASWLQVDHNDEDGSNQKNKKIYIYKSFHWSNIEKLKMFFHFKFIHIFFVIFFLRLSRVSNITLVKCVDDANYSRAHIKSARASKQRVKQIPAFNTHCIVLNTHIN